MERDISKYLKNQGDYSANRDGSPQNNDDEKTTQRDSYKIQPPLAIKVLRDLEMQQISYNLSAVRENFDDCDCNLP